MKIRDILEQSDQNRKLVIFDIDDTLVNTDTRVDVVQDGRVVRSLNSQEFTHYKLGPGEQFDFGRFRNAQEFFDQARPIVPMVNQLNHDIDTGNRVVMVTARADFDNRDLFLQTFRRIGVDIDGVDHVYRSGNLKDPVRTEEKKRRVISSLLKKDHYDKVIMYDDATPNLDAFLSLAQDYPWTRFYAWHVDHDGRAREYHRTGPGIREQGVAEGSDNLSYIGNCTDDDVIEHIFGDATGFAQAVEEHGDEFTIGDLVVKYDPKSDVHSFYYKKQGVAENFADGKNPGRKGLAKRMGVPTKASVNRLRQIAKSSSGEKQRMAHWMANMKAGKRK